MIEREERERERERERGDRETLFSAITNGCFMTIKLSPAIN